MPPTGLMTEALAARRIRHAVRMRKPWNKIDVQFLKQEGKLDELCKQINCADFTKQTRSLPEPEEPIAISGFVGASRMHPSRRSHDRDDERNGSHSGGDSNDRVIDVSQGSIQAGSRGSKRTREDPKRSSNGEHEPLRKKTTTSLPTETTETQTLRRPGLRSRASHQPLSPTGLLSRPSSMQTLEHGSISASGVPTVNTNEPEEGNPANGRGRDVVNWP